MIKNLKIKIALMLAISLFAALVLLPALVSCELLESQVERAVETQEIEESGEDTGENTEGDELITVITLWDSIDPKERLVLLESRDNFVSQNRDINIEIRHFRNQEELEDQFEASSLASAGPELILLDFDGVRRLAPENVAKAIEDEVDYNLIIEGLEEISSFNNNNYIIPFRSIDFLALFYNKDFIDQAPGDFDEVMEYNLEVNDPGEGQYGFLLNSTEPDWIIPFIGGYSGWIVDYSSNSLTLDNRATQKMLEFLISVHGEGGTMPYGLEYSEIDEMFADGRAHMIIDKVGSLGQHQEAGLNIGISKIPKVMPAGNYPTPMISGLGFMINVNCYGRQLEAVKDFMKYMLSEEVQMSWTIDTDTFPVLKDIDQNEGFSSTGLLFDAYQQAKISRGKPDDEIIRVIRDAIRDNIEGVISGNILPDEASLKIQEDAIRLRAGIVLEEEDEEIQAEG